jgi:hypothetical protein
MMRSTNLVVWPVVLFSDIVQNAIHLDGYQLCTATLSGARDGQNRAG